MNKYTIYTILIIAVDELVSVTNVLPSASRPPGLALVKLMHRLPKLALLSLSYLLCIIFLVSTS